MKKRKVLLGLMALVLVVGLGAKLLSDITMSDDDWIGLGASAGRVIFDDKATDQIKVVDGTLSVGTHYPAGRMEIRHNAYGSKTNPNLMLDYNGTNFGAIYMNSGWDLIFESLCAGGNLRFLTPTNSHISLMPGAGGKVGINDRTPEYDLDVVGDIRATGDVLANGTVFIGTVEDDDEDGGHMTTRADNADGGYVFFTKRNLHSWNTVIFERSDEGGDTGPVTVLWVQWLVHDNENGVYYEGDAIVTAGGASVEIAGGGANSLQLSFMEGVGDEKKGRVWLCEQGDHTYDVALLIMWVED